MQSESERIRGEMTSLKVDDNNIAIEDTTFTINRALFDNNTVGHLVWNQKDCVCIDCDTPVERALELMVMRGISSLPVKNKDGQWTGILNMADIVAHMVGYVAGAGDDPTIRDDGQKHRHMVPEGKLQEKEALKIPCNQLLGLTWESRHLVVFDAADRISNAVNRLSQGNHRGLVQGKGWWQVVSQWDIAVWLARHSREMDDPNLADNRREWLGSVVNATLGELKLATSKHVVTIPHDVSAIEGFRRLASNGVSAMPITAANGTLCGTLSISDMRGMDFSKWKSLELSVMEFLKVANLYQHPQVVANSHTKFGDLLLKIQARDVHRVWLVTGDNKPCGVVSLTDLLHRVYQLSFPEPKMLESDKTKQSSPAVASPSMSSRSGAHGTGELQQQQQGTSTAFGMKEKESTKSGSGALCGCTPSQKAGLGKGDVATKGTGGGGIGQCSYGNTSCTCPSSCICGGNQSSFQEVTGQGQGKGSGMATSQGQLHQGPVSGQKKAFGHEQQQQQQEQVQQGKIKH